MLGGYHGETSLSPKGQTQNPNLELVAECQGKEAVTSTVCSSARASSGGEQGHFVGGFGGVGIWLPGFWGV